MNYLFVMCCFLVLGDFAFGEEVKFSLCPGEGMLKTILEYCTEVQNARGQRDSENPSHHVLKLNGVGETKLGKFR